MKKKYLPFFLFLIFFICFSYQGFPKNIIHKSKYLNRFKFVNLDTDKFQDTIITVKTSNDSVFVKFIKWGIDSTKEKKITEIVYPDVKIVKSSYFVKKVNFDSIPDLVINIEYFQKSDTINLHLITKQIIIYVDSRIKNKQKLFLSHIKKFQRHPFLAQSESEDYLNTSLQYSRFHKKLIKEINKVNTDLLEEEQELVQDIKNLKNEPIFQIFPNPANNTLYLKGKNFQTATYTIVDINGNKVMKGEIANTGVNEIDINKLVNGVYTVIISNAQKVHFVQKVIISR